MLTQCLPEKKFLTIYLKKPIFNGHCILLQILLRRIYRKNYVYVKSTTLTKQLTLNIVTILNQQRN